MKPRQTPPSSPSSVDMYRHIFLRLAQKTPFEVVIHEKFPAPMAMSTEDITKPKLIINPRLCEEQFGFTPEEYGLVFSHEYFHYYEESFLRAAPAGDQWYRDFLQHHIVDKKPYSKAYHTLYNCLRDIYVNRSTLKTFPTRTQEMQQLYTKKLFEGTDYSDLPRHLQYIYALLRESMVPSEKCELSPEVREEVDFQLMRDKQYGTRIDQAAGVEQDLKSRLLYIAENIEPWFAHFLEQDIADRIAEKDKKDTPPPSKGEGSSGEDTDDTGSGEGEPSDGSGQAGKDDADGEDKTKGKKDADLGDEESPEGKKPSDRKDKGTGDDLDGKGAGDGEGEETDDASEGKDQDDTDGKGTGNEENNEPVDDPEGKKGDDSDGKGDDAGRPTRDDELYERGQMPHTIEETLSPEDLKKFQEYIDGYAQEELQRELDAQIDPQERRLRDKLEQMGVNPDDPQYEELKKDLRRIDKLALDEITNPQTHRSVIEEIEEILRKIAGRRTKTQLTNRGPVTIEKGQRLHLPSIAGGITDALMGKPDAQMFEMDVAKEKPMTFVGDFDLLLLADGSVSMGESTDGEKAKKNKQQQKAIMLILEAINRLHLGMQGDHLKRKLTCHTQVKMFTGSTIHELKPYGPTYDDRQKIGVLRGLDMISGSTGDYAAIADLEAEHLQLDEKRKAEIKRKERKKIVIVMTDGQSDNATELKKNIKRLREQGIVVIGVGITQDGKPVEKNYKSSGDKTLGYGITCPDVSLLPMVLFEVLKPHLEEL